MFASSGPGEGAEKHMRGVVMRSNLRCLIRLLQFHANDVLSEETWNEVLSLQNIESGDEKWLTSAEWIAMFTTKFTDTKLGRK